MVHGFGPLTLTLQETRSIHDSMNLPKINLLLIFTFNFRYLGANTKLVLRVRLSCGSLSVTTPGSHLANERIARASVLGSCQSNFVQFMRL